MCGQLPKHVINNFNQLKKVHCKPIPTQNCIFSRPDYTNIQVFVSTMIPNPRNPFREPACLFINKSKPSNDALSRKERLRKFGTSSSYLDNLVYWIRVMRIELAVEDTTALFASPIWNQRFLIESRSSELNHKVWLSVQGGAMPIRLCSHKGWCADVSCSVMYPRLSWKGRFLMCGESCWSFGI